VGARARVSRESLSVGIRGGNAQGGGGGRSADEQSRQWVPGRARDPRRGYGGGIGMDVGGAWIGGRLCYYLNRV
jgi:hypothetical protein